MAKYWGKISYDGSYFYGWAIQPSVRTVSGELIFNANKFLNESVKITGAGRTDRYVHALKQEFTIEIKNQKLNKRGLIKKWNEIPGLEVLSLKKVADDFDVRRGKNNKTYYYLVNNKKNYDAKLNSNYQFNYYFKIDFDKLNKQAQKLVGTKDFASFTAKENYKSTIRTVRSIIVEQNGYYISFTVEGPAFMRFMIRNLVGALLANNRDVLSDLEFDELLLNPKKGKAHYKAPGSGLYLIKIDRK
ncbi:MAG: tRNA pseudouridine(38-40) synthase TruA [Mycoplasmataceae bacterium]|nr:tRNA pseudouridine(38-40) synthase TruA [Mycoplasmataceae bacterium]